MGQVLYLRSFSWAVFLPLIVILVACSENTIPVDRSGQTNDAPSEPGVIGFTAAGISANETDGTVPVTVSRSGGFDGEITVGYLIEDITTTPGFDYSHTSYSGYLTFDDGAETPQTMNIALIDDSEQENEEQFQVTLSLLSGGATLGTSVFTITIRANDGASRDMPTGIPAPSFGLDEVAPSIPGAWPSSEAPGYYYIDNTHPNATDISNSYGCPDRPRITIPNYATYPAGTYIEVHGGPYQGNQLILTFDCTQQNPCWFRGPDENNKPIMRSETIAKGSYVIFENLKYDTDGRGIGFRSHNNSSLNHAVLRNSEISGSGQDSGNFSAVSISGNSANIFSDIVVYNNSIHDLGDHSPDAPENDYHGVHPDIYTERIWILNNHIYHMGGDSVQIGRAQTDSSSYSSHIYIGGNDFHDNHEDAIDIKKVNNVVISGNELHDLPKLGALVVAHDYPDNIWIINNEMYNATNGLMNI